MHLENLLEPWILLRLAAGVVTVFLFTRAAQTSWRVLRHFDVARYSEGQLALERRVDLAAALVRVGTIVQVALLALTMLVGDRLSDSIRGAMCGYGVFHASAWGFRALGATIATAIAAGVVAELYAFDARLRGFDLARPLAIATLLLAPLSAIDLGLTSAFALNLDLSAVASCCSVQLDAVPNAVGGASSFSATTRTFATAGAVFTIALAIVLALIAARHLRSRTIVAAAAASLVAFPFAVAASVLEVAPHVFEVPQHRCPFCLLRASVLGVGYPLFGAIVLAVVCALGSGVGALVSRTEAARSALRPFARDRLRREAFAWIAALIIGALPIARYAIVSGGASLFH